MSVQSFSGKERRYVEAVEDVCAWLGTKNALLEYHEGGMRGLIVALEKGWAIDARKKTVSELARKRPPAIDKAWWCPACKAPPTSLSKPAPQPRCACGERLVGGGTGWPPMERR